jgi:hypothetical protein
MVVESGKEPGMIMTLNGTKFRPLIKTELDMTVLEMMVFSSWHSKIIFITMMLARSAIIMTISNTMPLLLLLISMKENTSELTSLEQENTISWYPKRAWDIYQKRNKKTLNIPRLLSLFANLTNKLLKVNPLLRLIERSFQDSKVAKVSWILTTPKVPTMYTSRLNGTPEISKNSALLLMVLETVNSKNAQPKKLEISQADSKEDSLPEDEDLHLCFLYKLYIFLIILTNYKTALLIIL